MTLTELITTLRTDLGDDASVLFSDMQLQRCILKATVVVQHDMHVTLAITPGTGEIVPEPIGDVAEALLLLARINACGMKRSQTANAITVRSGDKSIEKTNQAAAWAGLEKDTWALYNAIIGHYKESITTDDGLLFPPVLRPVMFEQGVGNEDGPTDVDELSDYA